MAAPRIVQVSSYFPQTSIDAISDVRTTVNQDLSAGASGQAGVASDGLIKFLIQKFHTALNESVFQFGAPDWGPRHDNRSRLDNGSYMQWLVNDRAVLVSVRSISLIDEVCPTSSAYHEARNIDKSLADYIPAPGAPSVLGGPGVPYEEIFIIGPVANVQPSSGYVPPQAYNIGDIFIGAPLEVRGDRCRQWKRGSGIIASTSLGQQAIFTPITSPQTNIP